LFAFETRERLHNNENNQENASDETKALINCFENPLIVETSFLQIQHQIKTYSSDSKSTNKKSVVDF
jgi:hypothetical protein